MDKILFYDSKIDHLLGSKNKEFVINYFDIEVQKILKSLGYSFKRNPQFVILKPHLINPRRHFDYVCDLNFLILSNQKQSLCPKYCYATIFDCYI